MHYRDIKFEKGTRFLITGGAGFIGSNLAESLLQMGYEVSVMDDLSNGNRKNIEQLKKTFNFKFIEATICNIEECHNACVGVDYVLHQAAWGSIPRSIKMPLLYNEINAQGTLNMMEAAKTAGVKKFVYASSSSVYGDEPNLPKVEGREGKLLSPYAITKKINELYAQNYYELFGLKTVGLRYFNVFGKCQNPHSTYAAVIPVFIKMLLENKSPRINGDGTQSRDFTYIENVIEANIKACIAGDEANGEAFNIAFGETTSLNDLYDKIATMLGKKIKPNYGTPREGDVMHSLADISKARKLLDYNPGYDVSMGLDIAMDWYLKYLK